MENEQKENVVNSRADDKVVEEEEEGEKKPIKNSLKARRGRWRAKSVDPTLSSCSGPSVWRQPRRISDAGRSKMPYSKKNTTHILFNTHTHLMSYSTPLPLFSLALSPVILNVDLTSSIAFSFQAEWSF